MTCRYQVAFSFIHLENRSLAGLYACECGRSRHRWSEIFIFNNRHAICLFSIMGGDSDKQGWAWDTRECSSVVVPIVLRVAGEG